MKIKPIAAAVAAIAAVSLSSCSDRPDGILSKSDMTSLLIDVHKGEAVIDFQQSRYYNDSLRKVVKQSIYEAHGVTSEQVDSSFAYYGHHIEDYLEIYDDVIAKLEKDVAQGDADPSRVLAAGDSVNVWVGSNRFRLDENSPMRVLPYSIAAAADSKPGDNYQLQFKIINVSRSGNRPEIESAIIGEYTDGDMEFRTSFNGVDGWVRLHFVADSTKTLDKVFGRIKFDLPPKMVLYIDSLSLIRTRMIPEMYHQRAGQRRSHVSK